MALANAIVKNVKNSEKAFICLKAGWLLRGKAETIPDGTQGLAELKHKAENEERAFLKNALDGFKTARENESFPMCGMDENTVDYLIAALSVEFGEYDTASKLISGLLVTRSANERLKEKARDLRELIKSKH